MEQVMFMTVGPVCSTGVQKMEQVRSMAPWDQSERQEQIRSITPWDQSDGQELKTGANHAYWSV